MGETPPIQVLSVGTPQFAHQREPSKNQAKCKQVKKNKKPYTLQMFSSSCNWTHSLNKVEIKKWNNYILTSLPLQFLEFWGCFCFHLTASVSYIHERVSITSLLHDAASNRSALIWGKIFQIYSSYIVIFTQSD